MTFTSQSGGKYMPASSEISWANHHGCHGSDHIWTLPVVPLNTIVANHAGGGRVIYAVQVGRTASIKPPSCRRGSVAKSSR